MRLVLAVLLLALPFAAAVFMRPGGSPASAASALPAAPTAGATPARTRLVDVRHWAYQLQGLEEEGAVDRLVRAAVDMVVMEATNTQKGFETFPTADVVRRIKASAGTRPTRKICLAYVNVGQAEDYRTYWQASWCTPERIDEKVEPAFLICADPDGWPGNFPVAYWQPAWRAQLFGSPTALIDRALADGFDGAYLDWVLGFVEPAVKARAKRDGVDAARAMAELVRDLRAYARKIDPRFVVIAQNPGDLIDVVPEVVDWVDGIAQEGMSYYGGACSDWASPEAGDTPRASEGPDSTLTFARLLARYRKHELPVFTVDYARKPEHVESATRRSRSFGFVPCVTRSPLDRIPDRLLIAKPKKR